MAFLPLDKKFHPDFAIPGKKPVGGVELDLTNSIARRARVVMLPDGKGGQYDLVGRQMPTVNGTLKSEGSSIGLAQSFNKSTDYLSFANNDRFVPGEVGIFVIATWDGVYNNQSNVLVEKDYTSAALPFYVYRCIHSRSASLPNIDALWNQGGTFRSIAPTPTFAPTADKPFSYALSIKDGAQDLYGGNVGSITSQGSTAFSGTITNYNTPLQIGQSQLFTAHNQGGLIYLVLIVDGGFTEAEVRSLDKDPYQVLKPVTQTGYFTAEAGVTSALTGTATATITETDITDGGKTIIVTLTGDTFKAAGTGPIGSTADTQAFIDGFDAASSPTNGFNNEVRDKALTSEVVRTSSTIATWTISAQAGYDISAQETITGTIPTDVLVTGAGAITSTPTFTIDPVSGFQVAWARNSNTVIQVGM